MTGKAKRKRPELRNGLRRARGASVVIALRWPVDLVEAVENAAKAEGVSRSRWIEQLAARSVVPTCAEFEASASTEGDQSKES